MLTDDQLLDIGLDVEMVAAGVEHAEAQHNPDALVMLSAARKLLDEVERLKGRLRHAMETLDRYDAQSIEDLTAQRDSWESKAKLEAFGGREWRREAELLRIDVTQAAQEQLLWAADELDAQAAARGESVIDYTDHLRCFAEQPERVSIVPRPPSRLPAAEGSGTPEVDHVA